MRAGLLYNIQALASLEPVHNLSGNALSATARTGHAFTANLLGKFIIVLNVTLKGVQFGANLISAPEDPASEPPR